MRRIGSQSLLVQSATRFDCSPMSMSRADRLRKILKIALLHAAKACGLFSLARSLTGRGVRILGYHGIWLGDDRFAGDAMFMRAETFKNRLDRLTALGYPIVSLSDAVEALKGRHTIPRASVVITIDDGWFSSFHCMMPALAERGMPATLYCDTKHVVVECPIAHVMARYCRKIADPARIGPAEEALYQLATDVSQSITDRLKSAKAFCLAIGLDPDESISRRVFAYMTADELRKVQNHGIAIELHTHNHNLGDFSANSVADEITLNRQHLAALLGQDPKSFNHFCYPSGDSSPDVASALDSIGIASSTTTTTGLAYKDTHPQMLPRFLDGEHVTMIEFEAQMSGFSELAMRALGRRRSVRLPSAIQCRVPEDNRNPTEVDREPNQLA